MKLISSALAMLLAGTAMTYADSKTEAPDTWEDFVVPLEIPKDNKAGPHDRGFKGNGGKDGKGPKGGFQVMGMGGRFQFCPTGDCKESVIDVTMNHLREVDENGNKTKNRVSHFGGLDFNWTEPATKLVDTVNVTSSSFEATLKVNGTDASIPFKASVDYYAGNGTTTFAGTKIDVPMGSMKFALWIENWPFLADKNKLLLGLRVRAQNKKGDKKQKGEKKAGQGKDKKIDRVELQDSMFLDSPAVAEINEVSTAIVTRVDAKDDFVILEYEFPKFTKLYYDPVMTSDESTTDSTASGSSTGSTTGSKKSLAVSSVSFGLFASIIATMAMFAQV